ncbi:MAG: hypothetical protein OEZ36_07145 [Spirochaetota bacterium]|nr:hypothetical protein [Spirochaetota bacterium]
MLNHLAKISYKKNSFILHGKFSKSKNDFELKAFGDFDMLLFSIKYKDSLLSSRIHFDPLKEKNFNATHVGEDLWRIYFANSNTALKLFGINNKAFTESKIRLIYDRDNFLRKKLFYHNGKLIYKVIYKDYRKYYDIILPRIINCEHLVYKYKLKIITLTVNMAANK